MPITYIFVFTILGSILSLVGSLFLLARRNITESFSSILLNFAAGTLLGTAFLDLFPEALEVAGENSIFIPALLGFVSFFFAERFIQLFHSHHSHGTKPTVWLVLIGDGIHNFVDGVTIAVTFLTSIPLGITTSLAVAAHEVPQEIADMGILLANGLSKTRALLFNLLSALTALVGALIAIIFASFIQEYLYFFLGLAAGHFLYIAASDIIPELHEKYIKDRKFIHAGMFILGLFAVYTFTKVFEG